MLTDGKPCSHPGCLSHILHPCEGCGRIAGHTIKAEVLQESKAPTRDLTQQEKAVIAAPHPGDFGIQKEHWEAAKVYAKFWHNNQIKAEGLQSQKPFEMDWPDYHAEAMGCGLEDRGITDRYDAMRHGWDEAIERCAERLPVLYADPQPPAPCQKCAELRAEVERLTEKLESAKIPNSAKWARRYEDVLDQNNDLKHKIAEQSALIEKLAKEKLVAEKTAVEERQKADYWKACWTLLEQKKGN